MTERADDLAAWYGGWAGVPNPKLVLAAGDASFRKYYRVAGVDRGSVILCDAPPDTEKTPEFVRIAHALEAAAVRVPQVLHADTSRGFLILEDLGDRVLLPLLSRDAVEGFYGEALTMLERLARIDSIPLALPPYDGQLLAREMRLFPQWFCAGLLGMPPTSEAQSVFDDLERALCERALAQTQVVVHRDFHARNLMVLADGTLATIDFQDAVVGAVTYDPVSLLRDCYLRWPLTDVRRWVLGHRERLAALGVAVPAPEAFLVDFDWMGLQRHIKVLGFFARLYQRDGKAGYLRDLPRTLAYVREVLALYPQEPALARFGAWFEEVVVPRAQIQSWYRDLGPLPA